MQLILKVRYLLVHFLGLMLVYDAFLLLMDALFDTVLLRYDVQLLLLCYLISQSSDFGLILCFPLVPRSCLVGVVVRRRSQI